MTVTGLKREKGHLVRISFSEFEDVLIDLDVANGVPVKQGTDISPEKIAELKEISDYERAKSRALWYLDRSDRTEKGLYEKLVTAKFDKKASAKVISRLKELGLIDDNRYAKRYAERLIESGISKREIYAKLSAKGISRELAKETVSSFENDEKESIKQLIEKKYKNKMTDKNSIAKVYSALVRKGFSYGDVSDVLRQYRDEAGEEY